MRLPVAAALCVLVAGWAWAWLGWIPFERYYLDLCPPIDERSSYDIDSVLWPPGATRCTVVDADGTMAERLTFPWREWLSVALFAAGVGAGLAALTRPGSRLALAAACLGLCLASIVAFFIHPLLGLALAVLAGAPLLARGYSSRGGPSQG